MQVGFLFSTGRIVLASQYDRGYRWKEILASWQVQDAELRFREFLDATVKKGPQVMTRRGVETAVMVSIEAPGMNANFVQFDV